MSEKLCTLRTKGGGGGAKYTETVLWQNPSPASDFTGQTVTLSDSMSNYMYLAFAFKGVKSSTVEVRAVVSVEDLGKMNITSNTPDIRLSGTASANGYSRYVIKASDTTITFGTAYATNTTASDNSRAIPIQIVGIKKDGSGTKAKTVHGTGTMSTSATTKVTLNFRPDFVILECTKGTAEIRLVYDSAYGSSIQRLCAVTSGGTASYVKDSYPPTSTVGTRVSLIENDGFTITKLSQGNYDSYGADFSYIAGKYEV